MYRKPGLIPAARNRVLLALSLIAQPGPRFLWFWIRLRRSVRGWLSTRDAQLLYELARSGPRRGSIVEIGSAFGLSTIVLARGLRDGKRDGVVWTMDTHTFYESEAQLRSNIKNSGLGERIRAQTVSSVDAATVDAGLEIRMLYIDGLHTYEGVKADIENWLPRVVPGGVVVFDDYYDERPAIGVRRAVDEMLAGREIHSQDHLIWLRV